MVSKVARVVGARGGGRGVPPYALRYAEQNYYYY